MKRRTQFSCGFSKSLNKISWVFEEIFEELEEIKELEEQDSWVYAKIQQLYEGFEQMGFEKMNVEMRVLNFPEVRLFAAGYTKP